MKDVKKQEWPILGICQGLELISINFGGNDPKVLSKISIYGSSLPINWAVANVNESHMFKGFPNYLAKNMHTTGLALHAHSFAVSVDTFYKHQGLR
jgi:gamma-glutamyl-gamma-aminobutyrate hydrolase PuuD